MKTLPMAGCYGYMWYFAWFCNFSCFAIEEKNRSLANLRWPTRPQPIGSHYFHAWCQLCLVFVFCDGRTDTMCEYNDYLFGRGRVGQKVFATFFILLLWVAAVQTQASCRKSSRTRIWKRNIIRLHMIP